MVPGAIDVPQALTQPVAARLLDHYFGTPGPSQAAIAEWTTLLFWYLFIDLKADPDLDARATAAAAEFRSWMDGHIAARRAEGEHARTTCSAAASRWATPALPGMSDRDIRNNLIGLLIGELPTLSATANLALDELLDRPDAFAGACAAARAGDDATLAAYVFEALRFRPLNPLVYRRALRDTTIAGGRLRAPPHPQGHDGAGVEPVGDVRSAGGPRRHQLPHRPAVGDLHAVGLRHARLLRRAYQPRDAAGHAQAAARPAQPAPRRGRARADRQGRHAVPAALPPRVRHMTAAADRPKMLTFAPMVDSETTRLVVPLLRPRYRRARPSVRLGLAADAVPRRARLHPAGLRQGLRAHRSRAKSPGISMPRCRAERRLFPPDQPLAGEVAADWKTYNGGMGADVAVFSYFHLLPERALMAPIFAAPVPPLEAKLVPVVYGLLSGLFTYLLKLSPERAAEAADRMRATFDATDQRHRRRPPLSVRRPAHHRRHRALRRERAAAAAARLWRADAAARSAAAGHARARATSCARIRPPRSSSGSTTAASPAADAGQSRVTRTASTPTKPSILRATIATSPSPKCAKPPRRPSRAR